MFDKKKQDKTLVKLRKLFDWSLDSFQWLQIRLRPHLKNTFSHIDRYTNTDYSLILIAAILGIIIGVFIALFHSTMEYAENIFKVLGLVSTKYLKWYILAVPLMPMLGGLAIGMLKKFVFKDDSIQGLDHVVKAMVFKGGHVDWFNAFKSILYAGLSIGSGGSAGREGPTVVVGASIGSTIAELMQLKKEHVRVLCGSGAAAAISGIFNAPLGGIVFALEAVIGDVGIRAFVPLVIASVMATASTRILVGNSPLISAPMLVNVRLEDYIFLAIAGVLSGFVAVWFLKAYKSTFKFTEKSLKNLPDVLKPALGGLVAGLFLLILPTMLETTYHPINNAIAWRTEKLVDNSIFEYLMRFFNYDNTMVWGVIAAIITIFLKPIANAVTIASSGAGGTLAPAIKVGAMFGFVFGYVLSLIFPGSPPGLYATVCAGAVLAGAYQLPLSGGIILFEISRNYQLILPLVFAAVISSFIVQKMGVITFNPFQSDLVEDEGRLHPVLKHSKHSGKEK